MRLLNPLFSIGVVLAISLTPMPAHSGRGLLIPDRPIRITAVALAAAYDKDEAAADKKYKGRLLEVSGMISTIRFSEGPDGNRYMSVSLHGLEEPPRDIPYLGNVTCLFKNPNTSTAKLKERQEVIIRGTCEGVEIIAVYLDDCTLVSPSLANQKRVRYDSGRGLIAHSAHRPETSYKNLVTTPRP